MEFADEQPVEEDIDDRGQEEQAVSKHKPEEVILALQFPVVGDDPFDQDECEVDDRDVDGLKPGSLLL